MNLFSLISNLLVELCQAIANSIQYPQGIRNAGISLVGIAAVASIIGAGALGDFILLGVNTTSVDLILLGAIPAIVLAVMLDAILQMLERLFTSPGIRREA